MGGKWTTTNSSIHLLQKHSTRLNTSVKHNTMAESVSDITNQEEEGSFEGSSYDEESGSGESDSQTDTESDEESDSDEDEPVLKYRRFAKEVVTSIQGGKDSGERNIICCIAVHPKVGALSL